MVAQRVMPDPIPASGGILTRAELTACRTVLRAVKTTVCASVTLTWGSEETRAYVMLARAGYVASIERHQPTRKLGSAFGWDRIRATPAGLEWLRQVECGAADTPGV